MTCLTICVTNDTHSSILLGKNCQHAMVAFVSQHIWVHNLQHGFRAPMFSLCCIILLFWWSDSGTNGFKLFKIACLVTCSISSHTYQTSIIFRNCALSCRYAWPYSHGRYAGTCGMKRQPWLENTTQRLTMTTTFFVYVYIKYCGSTGLLHRFNIMCLCNCCNSYCTSVTVHHREDNLLWTSKIFSSVMVTLVACLKHPFFLKLQEH